MNPSACFFGFFMAAILNLPYKPISHKILLMLIFTSIVLIEKIADNRRRNLRQIYPLFKGTICFVSFIALSIVYTDNIFEHPLKLFGMLIGGGLFAMAVYMPIRFQDSEKRNASSDTVDSSAEENPPD